MRWSDSIETNKQTKIREGQSARAQESGSLKSDATRFSQGKSRIDYCSSPWMLWASMGPKHERGRTRQRRVAMKYWWRAVPSCTGEEQLWSDWGYAQLRDALLDRHDPLSTLRRTKAGDDDWYAPTDGIRHSVLLAITKVIVNLHYARIHQGFDKIAWLTNRFTES